MQKVIYLVRYTIFSSTVLTKKCLINIVDTVANAVQSSVDTTQKTASTALETGESYLDSAKGIFFH